VRKLSAQSFLMGKPITMEIAKSCLSELLGGAEPVGVTVDKIFTAVFKKYNISKEDLIGNKRNKEIAAARKHYGKKLQKCKLYKHIRNLNGNL
jgi:chromosomal replication initiator protein